MIPEDVLGEDRHAEEVEHAVVGALVLAADSVRHQMLEQLDDDDLTLPRARFLLATVRAMTDAGIPVDAVTVVGYLTSRALLAPGAPRIGAAVYVHDVVSAAPVPVAGPWYAALAVQASARRRIGQVATRLSAFAAGAPFIELRPVVVDEFSGLLGALSRAERAVKPYV